MGDRQDIDALLVGALYGELDGDERARLDVHLATHPADRAALDGLRSTRALLRDSGASAALTDAEPAAVISAKLLQEAARRAPSPLVATGVLGFFATLFRPMVRHPALSAAAALVLVVGVSRLMMRDGKLDMVQPEAPSFREPARMAAAPPAPTGAAGSGASADGDAYKVDLDETEGAAKAAKAAAVATGSDQLAGEQQGQAAVDGAEGKLGDGRLAAGAKLRADNAKDAPRPTSKPTASGAYIAIDPGPPADVALKNLDSIESETARNTASNFADAPGLAQPRDEAAPIRDTDDAVAVGGSLAQRGQGVGSATTRAPTVPAAPATTARTQAPAPDPGANAESLKKEAGVTAWARDQHARMLKLNNDGKCTEVGQIGREISSRAPDYYQTAVVNDRALRSCQAYVDRARRAKVAPAKSKAGNASPAANERQNDSTK